MSFIFLENILKKTLSLNPLGNAFCKKKRCFNVVSLLLKKTFSRSHEARRPAAGNIGRTGAQPGTQKPMVAPPAFVFSEQAKPQWKWKPLKSIRPLLVSLSAAVRRPRAPRRQPIPGTGRRPFHHSPILSQPSRTPPYPVPSQDAAAGRQSCPTGLDPGSPFRSSTERALLSVVSGKDLP